MKVTLIIADQSFDVEVEHMAINADKIDWPGMPFCGPEMQYNYDQLTLTGKITAKKVEAE